MAIPQKEPFRRFVRVDINLPLTPSLVMLPLAVPLLIITKTIFSAAGTPDIAGFLFEHGTLTHIGDPDEEEEAERQQMQPAMVDTPKASS